MLDSRERTEERAQTLYLAPLQHRPLVRPSQAFSFSRPPIWMPDVRMRPVVASDSLPTTDSSSLWWHFMPRFGSILPDAYTWKEGTPKVFWRGDVASYVKEEVPIMVKRQWHPASACTLRYRVQVDLYHGRLVCLQPIEENVEPSVAHAARKGLWQQRFSRSDAKGIISGEVELCFGGEYEE